MFHNLLAMEGQAPKHAQHQGATQGFRSVLALHFEMLRDFQWPNKTLFWTDAILEVGSK